MLSASMITLSAQANRQLRRTADKLWKLWKSQKSQKVLKSRMAMIFREARWSNSEKAPLTLTVLLNAHKIKLFDQLFDRTHLRIDYFESTACRSPALSISHGSRPFPISSVTASARGSWRTAMACAARRLAVPNRSPRSDWSDAMHPLAPDHHRPYRSPAERWTPCSTASGRAADYCSGPDWSVDSPRSDLWSAPSPPCPHWRLGCFSLTSC